MHLAIQHFNEEQKFWYAQLLVSVIKADGIIHEAELDYLILALHFLNLKDQARIKQILKLPTDLPGLQRIPEGLTQEDLIKIYTQLVLVAIADTNFSVKEQSKLTHIRIWFRFNHQTEENLQTWTEDIFTLMQQRNQLLANSNQA